MSEFPTGSRCVCFSTSRDVNEGLTEWYRYTLTKAQHYPNRIRSTAIVDTYICVRELGAHSIGLQPAGSIE